MNNLSATVDLKCLNIESVQKWIVKSSPFYLFCANSQQKPSHYILLAFDCVENIITEIYFETYSI